jgi:hypothetical protein
MSSRIAGNNAVTTMLQLHRWFRRLHVPDDEGHFLGSFLNFERLLCRSSTTRFFGLERELYWWVS